MRPTYKWINIFQDLNMKIQLIFITNTMKQIFKSAERLPLNI